MVNPKIDVDDIWRGLGKWGNYQKVQFGLCLFNIWPCTFQLLSIVFIGYRPNFQCKEMDDVMSYLDSSHDLNGSYFAEYKKCEIEIYRNSTNGSSLVSTQKCPNGYAYAIPSDRTFVTEWDLVCGNEELAEFSQTLLMLGQAIGAAMAASLSDRFGRKKLALISHIGVFSSGFGLAFAPNYTAFAVFRFCLGLFQQGMAMTIGVLMLEVLPREDRFWSEITGLSMWTTGCVLLTPLGYFLQDYSWRYTQIALTLYSSYSLIQYWIQDESLRWLLINGKTVEAERIIRKAAKWNGVRFEDVMKHVQKQTSEKSSLVFKDKEIIKADLEPVNKNDQDLIPSPNTKKLSTVTNVINSNASNEVDETKHTEFEVKRYTILTLLQERRVLVISLILWLTWITNSLTYFGLILTTNTLAGNRFLNYFLTVAVEYPAVFVQYFTLNRLGRKITTIIFHLQAGIALISATLVLHFGGNNAAMITLSTALTLIGKMGITGSFSTIFLYTPELYPTNLRNAGIGFASSAARIGSMMAPFAGTLAKYIQWGPGTIFSGLCMLVSGLLLYLPETAGHELPQTMDEIREWYREHSGATKKKNKKKEKQYSDQI